MPRNRSRFLESTELPTTVGEVNEDCFNSLASAQIKEHTTTWLFGGKKLDSLERKLSLCRRHSAHFQAVHLLIWWLWRLTEKFQTHNYARLSPFILQMHTAFSVEIEKLFFERITCYLHKVEFSWANPFFLKKKDLSRGKLNAILNK